MWCICHNWRTNIDILLNSILYSHFSFFLMTFFCSRILFRIPYTFNHVSLGSFWLWQFLNFDGLDSFEEYWSCILYHVPLWEFVWFFFLWWDLGSIFLGGRPFCDEYHSHITSRVYRISTTCCWPWSAGWGTVCRVSPL